MKKVLILTSEKTGNGHRSSGNAIAKRLADCGFMVKQVNCFTKMGKQGVKMENAYVPLTTKHPFIWKIAHKFSEIFTNTLHNYIYHISKKEILKEILDYKPDFIISVHGMFTKAISKLLKKNNLKIPFAIVVIDLVNPPKVWRDKSADILFLPTEKVKQEYLKLGFNENQLVVSGFPIREDIIKPTEPKTYTDIINALMINPSINLKKNIAFLRELSSIENLNITFVCGLDEKLYSALNAEKNKNESLKDVQVFGFVKNIDELLASCHILFTKAGPNMMLEGTRSGSAVVVTGHIPGQEAKNHLYITENNYGIRCENPKKIKQAVLDMINSGKLNEYLNNTLNSTSNDGAKIIVNEIEKYFDKNK